MLRPQTVVIMLMPVMLVRVRAVPPPLVTFDGGTFGVTNSAAGHLAIFPGECPSDALGWDFVWWEVTNGNPQLVVGRDTLPTG